MTDSISSPPLNHLLNVRACFVAGEKTNPCSFFHLVNVLGKGVNQLFGMIPSTLNLNLNLWIFLEVWEREKGQKYFS